jgi:predicted DNA-binding transcriptional regulator YafY
MLFIDNALSAGAWPNARTLARELEVDSRTIRRDIEYMRDQLQAPIEWNATKNGYSYTVSTYRFLPLKLTEDELVAVLVAEKVLRQYRGTPYGPDLARAFQKITDALNDPIRTDPESLSAAISFRTSAPVIFEVTVLQTLLAAIVQRRRIVIDYWSASRNEQERREVDPYHLAVCDGQYYLFAHCHARNAIRQFVPARIRDIASTETFFTPPESFDVNDYLSGSLAAFGCGRENERTVKLRFTGQSIPYIRERLWHPTQRLDLTPEGDLVMTFEVSHLREVERLVLTWAPECEALEPPELRERVARALEAGAKMHGMRRPRDKRGKAT